ncbi:MAG: PHP domain-containing protein [Alcanivoracaceae bacterium]|nr:PHP domain-containing protein [Alcanivoracaceae bacterium]
MRVDFHCHSSYSDGILTPQELIKKAEERDIKIFSITDHDNIDAHKELYEIRDQIKTNVKIISGIEFSTTWNKIGIHIVGLNFNINSKELQKAIVIQKSVRQSRAKIISKKLEKYGIFNAYEKIVAVKNNGQIGRPDFANLLVEEGVFKDCNQAFKKVLGAGKPGDIKNKWIEFKKIIETIKSADGIAVLAHPLYYKLTNTKLKRLLQDFSRAGGEGLEVINGYQNHDKTNLLFKLCKEFDFKASIGSDFHFPSKWSRLGCDAQLPADLNLVWDAF